MYGTDMYVMEETIMVVNDTVNDNKISNGNKNNFFLLETYEMNPDNMERKKFHKGITNIG